jgi:hypothetical protein
VVGVINYAGNIRDESKIYHLMFNSAGDDNSLSSGGGGNSKIMT